MTNNELIEMICTRICHDIISSSQGILQGVESLDDSDASFVEQSKLFIKDSAQTLNSKLIFFRSLCGRAGKLASVAEVKEFGGNFLDFFNKRVYEITYEISGESDNITILKAGLAFCCIVTDTLIRGGTLYLDFDGNSLVCRMKGAGLKLNELIFGALEGDLSKVDPKSAVAAYLMLLLKEERFVLTTEFLEDEIKLIVKEKQ